MRASRYPVNDPSAEAWGLGDLPTGPSLSSPSSGFGRQGDEGTPFVRSGHPGTPPRFLALSFSIKSPFGVSGGVLDPTSWRNIGERSCSEMPSQVRTAP